MFHVELRQFPHLARLLNLDREELDTRILTRWVRGESFEHDDHRWLPDRTRLTIYEAPKLEPDQIGMGRGWATVTRAGADVTAALLEEAQSALRGATPGAGNDLREELLSRCAAGPTPVRIALSIASTQHPDWRVSERLALAEQTVWELLHRHEVRMLGADGPVPSERWQAILFEISTWSDPEAPVLLESAAP